MTPNYEDLAVTNGTLYYYTVKSVDTAGILSSASNEVSARPKVFQQSSNPGEIRGPADSGIVANATECFEHKGLMPYRLIAQGMPYAVVFLHHDHLGSLRYVTSSSGLQVALHKYLPYGQELQVSANRTPFGYAGYEKDDESQMNYVGARYYDSNRSRWLSADPLGSGFGYVRDNPLNLVDPSGLYWQCPQGPSKDTGEPLPCTWIEDPVWVPGDQPGPTGYVSLFPPSTPIPRSLGPNTHNPVGPQPYQRCPPVPPAPRGVDIDRIVIQSRMLGSDTPEDIMLWTGFVTSHGVWDFKRYPGGNYGSFGNFAYGATGGALGMPLNVLLWGAGLAQTIFPSGSRGQGSALTFVPPYSDHDDDPPDIKSGYQYQQNGCP